VTDYDTELRRLQELAALEVEGRLWAAEAAAVGAAADDLEMRLFLRLNPDHPVAKAHERYAPGGRSEALRLMGRDGTTVEGAAYGWRRDYAEWPTLYNLADRYAADAGISRAAATKQIIAAVDDPSSDRGLHVIRRSRLLEIMNDEPNTCGPTWSHRGEEHLVFYVAAEAQEILATIYRITTASAA
jgi:hypothetical protein